MNWLAQPQHLFTQVLGYPKRRSQATYLYTLLPKIRSFRLKAILPQKMGQDCKVLAFCLYNLVLTFIYSGSSACEPPATYSDFHDTGSLLPPPASIAPYPPGTTHYVSSSSGYGPSQAVSDGPPVSASTSGVPQANPRYVPKPKQGVIC